MAYPSLAQPPVTAELERLASSHRRSLLAYAYRLLHDWELAEDVVQEVFLRYLREPLGYGELRQRVSWMFRVAHNLCIDLLRKESRRAELRERLDAPRIVPAATQVLMAGETWNQLEALLDNLSVNQRSVLVLFFQEGMTYREIAEVTGLSISNVGMLLHRGLKKLRKLVEKIDF